MFTFNLSGSNFFPYYNEPEGNPNFVTGKGTAFPITDLDGCQLGAINYGIKSWKMDYSISFSNTYFLRGTINDITGVAPDQNYILESPSNYEFFSFKEIDWVNTTGGHNTISFNIQLAREFVQQQGEKYCPLFVLFIGNGGGSPDIAGSISGIGLPVDQVIGELNFWNNKKVPLYSGFRASFQDLNINLSFYPDQYWPGGNT